MRAGLGPIVSSWTAGAAAGQPVSVDQLKGALDAGHIEQIASQLGLSPDNALAALAEHLPGIVAAKQAQS
ncbi:MAG: YidB family protein [Rhizomicrobium sp.]